ncbi:hypothetical protein ES332_D01G094700v1 [Gossypium tomentosum]|uniref:Transmembrane protein n=1 Tax=Gossypium tomentosum TaxID=34277 RepID=A0A5D2M721_GOSTO|nr:hypothetical protein ES332_D01G094700v1 [Gossypium tomentosum]
MGCWLLQVGFSGRPGRVRSARLKKLFSFFFFFFSSFFFLSSSFFLFSSFPSFPISPRRCSSQPDATVDSGGGALLSPLFFFFFSFFSFLSLLFFIFYFCVFALLFICWLYLSLIGRRTTTAGGEGRRWTRRLQVAREG